MTQQQSICPFTYVVPPVEEYFFTDASMSRVSLGGTYGFVYKDQDLNIKDRFVGYSVISNIHYLECKAIYFCLCYIYWRAYPGIKYYIFTDSTACFRLFQKLHLKEEVKIEKDSWFYKQAIEVVELFKHMIQQSVDIRIIDVKGHCNGPQKQQRYLKRNGFDLDTRYAKLITNGNNQIDKLVGNANNNKNQYPYLLYDN